MWHTHVHLDIEKMHKLLMLINILFPTSKMVAKEKCLHQRKMRKALPRELSHTQFHEQDDACEAKFT